MARSATRARCPRATTLADAVTDVQGSGFAAHDGVRERSERVAHGWWSRAHPSAPHPVGAVDEEDHARDGAHRGEPHREGAGTVRAAQPYADGITDVVRDLRGRRRGEQPAARRRGTRCARWRVVIGADRGLVRWLQLAGDPRRRARDRAHEAPGREYRDRHRRPQGRGLLPLPQLSRSTPRSAASAQNPSYEDAREVAAAVIDAVPGRRARPRAARRTPQFISAGRQEVVVEPLLPLDGGGRRRRRRRRPDARRAAAAYEFEPEPEAILDALLPRYARARIYAALLNAAASEHAARQRAMKAATDNADELITTPQPGHEPRPPGRDHHRDHGDRRRRRGAAGRRRERRARTFDFGGVRAALTASHTVTESGAHAE